MSLKREHRLTKLGLLDSIIQDNKDFFNMITNNNKSAPAPNKTLQQQPQSSQPLPPAQFDPATAVAYNMKSEQYFKNYEQDVKRVLGTSADWKTPEFAKAVYDWQQRNGFSGKWLDGKFGPATMGKIAKTDSVLAKNYDAYTPWKAKHINDKPYQRVVNLTGEVDRIRKEMGATDIPLGMLMGWIQVESGGKLNNLTTSAGFRETGLFQISTDEAKAIGADQDRIMQDRDYAIKTGITLARHHAQRVEQALRKHPNIAASFQKGSDMYWRLAMFGFSAGDGTMAKLVDNMASSGEEFKTWDDVMRYAAEHPTGYKHSPIKWTYHINRAFNLGNQMAGTPQVLANVNILIRIKSAKRKARKLFLDKLS